ncbi:hypothetical protein [Dictyobacter arantiisoli]|uniref:hypothetical protein n=1 Tax=Dictyobacter arantiisoli TaxID=2014874 RepID=UPI0011EF5E52|nr:hypothetical protein [Dictyobacter arantiisoli]
MKLDDISQNNITLFTGKSHIYREEPYLQGRAIFTGKSHIYREEPYLQGRAIFTGKSHSAPPYKERG